MHPRLVLHLLVITGQLERRSGEERHHPCVAIMDGIV